MEGAGVSTQWQEAIVIPFLRPGKIPKNPLSYRPIALTKLPLCCHKHLLGERIDHHYSECIRQSYSLASSTDVLHTDQRATLLCKKLDPVHHMALRICSGAFRTSPVQSLYVICHHQLPLDLRRRKLSLAFRSCPCLHIPLQNVYMSTSMKRLYDARPSNYPAVYGWKLHDFTNSTYLTKSTVAPVVFQRVFAYHRSQYSRYSAIYTDGSKRADYVGCGVVIEDIMHGYRLDTSTLLQHFHCRSCRHLPCTSINRLHSAP
ncbi:RNase H domain-containing protein [Trichonephila clavipes]|nr:RNase H domain-containing protein [Trichonephila clavipes]